VQEEGEAEGMRELEEGMEGAPWASEREDDDDRVVKGVVTKEVI
jgi:hypothetical protein